MLLLSLPRSHHTMLKFFKSSYLDNHLSESVHIGTIIIGTSEGGFHSINPDPRVHAPGFGLEVKI